SRRPGSDSRRDRLSSLARLRTARAFRVGAVRNSFAAAGDRRLSVLPSHLDRSSPEFRDNRAAMLEKLAEMERQLELARAGGGEKYVTRHRARGKLLPRARVEALLDRDAPFLELSPLAGVGTEYAVGASVVTGVGVVSGVECAVIAHDP